MDGLSKTLVESVLSLPTMSFHETAVSTFVRWYCAGLGLPVKEDKAGNLIVKYDGARLPRPRAGSRGGQGRSGNITLTAHMDHPGFEVIAAKGKRGTVALWGKVDTGSFSGSKVVVHTADGPVKARIGAIKPISVLHMDSPGPTGYS